MEKIWFIYSLAAMTGWGLWGFLVKLAERSLSSWAAYIAGSIGAFLPPLLLLIFVPRLTSGWQSKAGLLAFFAGMIGGLAVLFFFLALSKGSASVVVPLTALYPVITVLLGYLILKERLTPVQWIGILLAFLAAIFLSR